MPSYEQQLETYLKNHGIDTSIKYNDYYNRYDITFTTIIEEICISINFNDIHYDFGLVAAMITAYKQIDQQVETDWAEVDIKQISSSQILIKFEIVQVLYDTTFESPSGTNVTLSITDTFKKSQLTFTREKIVSRANLNAELANEVQAIIDDVKQYSV